MLAKAGVMKNNDKFKSVCFLATELNILIYTAQWTSRLGSLAKYERMKAARVKTPQMWSSGCLTVSERG
jgi:hypothetical protein